MPYNLSSQKQRNAIFLFIVLLGISGCQLEPEIPTETTLIANQTFNSGLLIDGHEYDGLVIENCTFTKGRLHITNADNVTIRNCSFKDIDESAIWVGFFGKAKNILIEDSHFEDISFNGVDSHEDAPNGIIRNCTFKNVGRSGIGAAFAQPYHSIYWKGTNVTVEDNLIFNGNQLYGDLVSIRSSGIVQRNFITGATQNAIMYFADHPGGDSLIIQNNFLYNNAYSFTMPSAGEPSWHNNNVIFRFNTLVQDENYSVNIDPAFNSTTNTEMYGNIIVNSSGEYFRDIGESTRHHNLETTNPIDLGFVNLDIGDLHITESSPAGGFCNGLTTFPLTDIDNQSRFSSNLDAGADEIN